MPELDHLMKKKSDSGIKTHAPKSDQTTADKTTPAERKKGAGNYQWGELNHPLSVAALA